MLNQFKVGDLVRYPSKERTNGKVLNLMCNDCAACNARNYESCASLEKNKVMVEWTTNDKDKPFVRYKYSSNDLLPQEPTSVPSLLGETNINGKSSYQGYDMDTRKLSSIEFDSSPIDEEEVPPNLIKSLTTNNELNAYGITFEDWKTCL